MLNVSQQIDEQKIVISIPDMFWTSMYVDTWVFTFTGFTRILAEVKNDSFTNNKIECYAWDAETIDSSKSFQSLQSRSIAIETKNPNGLCFSFPSFYHHFDLLLFWDFEDDTEVIDSIFYYISELKQRG